jgi:hypothetical protein
MKNTSGTIRRIIAIAVMMVGFGVSTVFAQLPPPPPPTQVPIDGGVILLAAAGAAYGAKKVYNKRKSTGNK